MHELSLCSNSANSGPTEDKHNVTNVVGYSEDGDWPLIPLMMLSVLPSEILRRNIIALDQLVKENEEIGCNEVALNEYIAKQKKRVVQELSIRDVKDSGSLTAKEREKTEQGCNRIPADEERWKVPVSASNHDLIGGEKEIITSQPACRGKKVPRRNRSSIIPGREQMQQVPSIAAEQQCKIINSAVTARLTTNGIPCTLAAPIPAFVVASVGGKRRSQAGHRRRALDEVSIIYNVGLYITTPENSDITIDVRTLHIFLLSNRTYT